MALSVTSGFHSELSVTQFSQSTSVGQMFLVKGASVAPIPIGFPIGSVTPGRVTIHAYGHTHARIKVQSFIVVQLKIKPGSTFAFEFKHSFVSKWNSGSMGMVCTESVSAQLHIQTRLEVPL